MSEDRIEILIFVVVFAIVRVRVLVLVVVVAYWRGVVVVILVIVKYCCCFRCCGPYNIISYVACKYTV